MQPSAFERDEPRLIERPQGAAAALLRDATQAGSQPAGPTVDNGKKATVVSYNLVDGLYILQIEGESSASLLGYKKTKSWVIH